MRARFFIDPTTDRPHLEKHGVSPQEAIEILERGGQDYMGDRGARIALGRTRAGRYLKVMYRPDESSDDVFVITAYPLRGKGLKAYRRRLRHR